MPSKQARSHGLEELEEDRAFQRKFWMAERVAWAGYVLVLALALLGLTGGGGPLSDGRFENEYGAIEYPRVARWQGVDQMRIELAPAVGPQADIELDHHFVRTFEITDIEPEPSSAVATPGGVRYRFDVSGGGAVTLHLRPTRPAFFPAVAMRLESARHQFRPLVLP